MGGGLSDSYKKFANLPGHVQSGPVMYCRAQLCMIRPGRVWSDLVVYGQTWSCTGDPIKKGQLDYFNIFLNLDSPPPPG